MDNILNTRMLYQKEIWLYDAGFRISISIARRIQDHPDHIHLFTSTEGSNQAHWERTSMLSESLSIGTIKASYLTTGRARNAV